MSKIKSAVRRVKNYIYINSCSKNIKKVRANNHSKKVLFLCQNEAVWPKSEPVFLELKKLGVDCKLLVLKDNDSLKEGPTVFEKKYPDDVIKYTPGILDSYKPQLLIYSRPYENYLPEDLHVKNAIKRSLLAYIPYYFALTYEFGLNSPVFLNSLSFYFADQESAADFFKKACKRNIAKGTNNCVELGYPEMDELISRLEEKNTNSSMFVKNREGLKIIWSPRWTNRIEIGGSFFSDYKDVLFDKLINDNKYSFVFRPHPLLFAEFIRTGALTVEEKDNILKRLEESNNSIYDNTSELYGSFIDSDVLISDYSSVIPDYALTGKPLIYCGAKNKPNYTPFIKRLIETSYEVHNKDELVNYIDELQKGNDPLKEKRAIFFEEIMRVHKGASKRIAEYIKSQLDN